MSKDLILAIDQGTTGTTCLLVDSGLNIAARANRELPQHFPRPGWVEHDAHELWATVCGAISDVLEKGRVTPASIAAIGVTNQRETSLIWHRKDGSPIHRALVWQDRRTSDACERLRSAGHADRIHELTGLVVDPYFSATKLAWMLDNVGGARKRAETGDLACGTVDTYLVWRLTGGKAHVTEPSNASRTMLWSLTGGDWSDELCDLLNVPRTILPRVQSCKGRFGTTVDVPGLPDGIPIFGVLGDQQSALFAQACFEPGQAKCTYGTGAFAMLNTGKQPVWSSSSLLTTVGWEIDGETVYCLEGSAFMAGAVVQWLRDGLGFFGEAKVIEALATSVEDSDGVVLVPGHVGLGAPYWRPHARGLICGLTRGTTRAHIARAALEGIALQTADLLDAMTHDTGEPLTILRVDGGAAVNDLLMQIQADLLGVPLERPVTLETTALGAVFMAGLGAGIWSDTKELEAAWKKDREFTPSWNLERVVALRKAWKQAVEKA